MHRSAAVIVEDLYTQMYVCFSSCSELCMWQKQIENQSKSKDFKTAFKLRSQLTKT